ncbi:MAG TPA: dipeptidase, partial [Gemmatimonadales bacterium]|nr:dipeptidase [Gemmatimonadales bacterium]
MERWKDATWRWGQACVLIVLLSSVPAFQLSVLSAQDYRAQALRILRTTPLIDGHNDIPDAIRERGGLDSVDLSVSQPRLMTDIPRLRAGAVGAQFWAAYVPVSTIHEGTHPAVYALEQIDLTHRVCARYPQTFAEARTAADIERNFKAGKISCLIGIEGGHAIENSLGALRAFAELGVRYMTLTHWETIDWADAATDSAKHDGLTAFGEDVVREMNRVGMLVDLSHVSDATMLDALRVSRAPVIFSHSSARALDNHVRNVPDSILRLVARNGGIVMTNFAPDYVSEALRAFGDTVAQGVARLRAAGLDSAAVRDSLRR